MAHLDPTLYAVATGEHLDGVTPYATAGQRLDVDSFDLHEELDPLEELEVRVAGEEAEGVYALQLFEYGEPLVGYTPEGAQYHVYATVYTLQSSARLVRAFQSHVGTDALLATTYVDSELYFQF